MKAGFIGSGKVGCSLGKYLGIHGVQIAGYYDRDTEYAEEAAGFVGTTVFPTVEDAVRESDVLFITVPDGVIPSVFEEVKSFDLKGKFICHCSGSISAADAFSGIDNTGAYGYSVHPLFAVSDRFETYRELADAFFTLEGNSSHIDDMRKMLEDAGLKVRVIDSKDKAKYHLAAVITSNLMLALLDTGFEKLTECGFSEEDARKAIRPLVMGNVTHAIDAGTVKALTGPVERGDVKTLSRHLEQIDDPDQRQLYLLLSGRLLHIAKKRNPNRNYEELESFLERTKK